MSLLIALVPMIAWYWFSQRYWWKRQSTNVRYDNRRITIFNCCLFVIQPTLTTATLIVGFISGLFWSLGQNQQFHSMKYMGVSVGLPISTGMQLVVNTVAGAVFP